jgi:hypothetical protein
LRPAFPGVKEAVPEAARVQNPTLDRLVEAIAAAVDDFVQPELGH